MTPTVQQTNGDTLFCFTISQSKEIAKQIEANTYCDSLLVEQQKLLAVFDRMSATKDSIREGLTQKVLNLQQLNGNRERHIGWLEKTVKIKDRELKQSKVHKILLGIGLGLMTVLAAATG